jgi:hypothetical protein
VSDVERLRALAAAAGYHLVKGKGTVVGKHDYGRFGLEDAKTGHKAFGFGPRGVKARAEEIEHFLQGGEKNVFDDSLKGSKRRKLRAPRP